jgi:hypothetical protein
MVATKLLDGTQTPYNCQKEMPIASAMRATKLSQVRLLKQKEAFSRETAGILQSTSLLDMTQVIRREVDADGTRSSFSLLSRLLRWLFLPSEATDSLTTGTLHITLFSNLQATSTSISSPPYFCFQKTPRWVRVRDHVHEDNHLQGQELPEASFIYLMTRLRITNHWRSFNDWFQFTVLLLLAPAARTFPSGVANPGPVNVVPVRVLSVVTERLLRQHPSG